jgi:NADH:ubiquinone oxidoreductase subunit
MSLGTWLFTLCFGEEVGRDEFGNRYYLDRRTKGRKREKRWVLYRGIPEASKVPPLWYGWLHGTSDTPPANNSSRLYDWQKPHLPNLTGTNQAYLPPGHPSRPGGRKPIDQDYEAWSPNGR